MKITGRGHALRNAGAAAVAATITFAALLVAPATAGHWVRACGVIGFSPRFATDRTAYCVTNEYPPHSTIPTGTLLVTRTTDGGATWERLPAVGLQGLGLASPSQLLVSPDLAEDETLYVQVVYGTNPGLYRSTDGGDTFVNLAPLAGTGYWARTLTPFTSQAAVPEPLGGGREAFAYASPYETSPSIVAPPLQQPVVGAPGATEMFLLPEDFPESPGLALSRGSAPSGDPAAPEVLYSAYRCDATLTCTAKVHDFPAGWTLGNAGVMVDGSFYVMMRDFDDPAAFEVWRSDGSSFSRWDSLNARLPDLSEVTAFRPAVSVVAAPGDTVTFYARVSYLLGSSGDAPPADQVFESRDGGTTWRRVSFGRGLGQHGRDGAIPWNRRAGPVHAEGDLYMPAEGLLVVVAERSRDDGTYSGVFCSRDGGRSWSERCG